MHARAAALLLAAAACSATGARKSAPPDATPAAPAAPLAQGLVARYEVTAAGGKLEVVATVAPGTAGRFTVSKPLAPYVDVAGAERDGASWEVPSCARGCTLRYAVRLWEGAAEVDDWDEAARSGDTVMASPAGWILAPAETGEIEIAVKGDFATAMRTEGGAYRASLDDLFFAPPAAFGAMRTEPIQLEGGTLEVAIGKGAMGLDAAAYHEWIKRRATIVTRYLGKFPVPRALVVMLPKASRQEFGKTFGAGGAATVVITSGEDDTLDELDDDWVLIHELLHLSHPNLDYRHHWLEEGIATYAESIARARAGDIPAERAWRELAVGLPKGLPQDGDRGLDRTPTWGRTYWGGALFCFVADVEIRKRTGNARGLEDALRGINEAGGNIYTHWRIEEMLGAGDRAVGVEVLLPLYRRLAFAPGDVDLGALFRELGVAASKREAHFDDAAPGAAIRKALMAPRS